jgi:ABC-2 type transport system ATP-binding protein
MSKNIIEINGLTKYYGKHMGIDGVTFRVEEGEIYGFIGPNGAGKSTTIRTLLALIHPTGGSAAIFGKDCIKEAEVIAKDVGYLPSEVNYYENMKVSELLNYTARLYGKDCRKKTDELCSRLNLDVTRKIADLSFGNKKKVGIVSALLHSPKLIILDEPTSGLDPLVQQTFFDILREENEKGATILFSSHVLSEVQKTCSRVAILKGGKVVSVQLISELREKGYKKIALTAKKPIPAAYFDGLNIADYKQNGESASFLFMGDSAQIIEKLHLLGVSDIFIEEPTLEEIFLHYYE